MAKASAELVRLFQQLVPAGPTIQQKPMFGHLCAFVNGKLFTGLFRESMLFRLSPSDQAAFLDQPDTSPFEPMPGHRMTGFVLCNDPFGAREDELANWMLCAMEFAAKLPAKKKKTRNK